MKLVKMTDKMGKIAGFSMGSGYRAEIARI
jgi:hypothetical protein